MADSTRDWQQYLQSLQGDAGPHLSDQTLAAYRAGALSPAEDEAIQDHLVGCPLCSQILLELAAPLDGSQTLPPFDGDSSAVAPDWASLRQELAGDGWFEPPRPAPAAPKISWWRRLLFPPAPVRWAYAGLAAVLLVSAVFFAMSTQVVPLEGTTRGADPEIQLSRWVLNVVFVLPAVPLPDSPDFQVRLLGSEKRTVFEQRGLRPRRDGTIPVQVPRWKLFEGSYVLELEGMESGRAVPIETFSFLLKGSS